MPATSPMSASTSMPVEFWRTLQATDDLIKSLSDDDGSQLFDAVFFSKLQELRREHKRSLKLIEDLYRQMLLAKAAAHRRSHSAAGRNGTVSFGDEDETENRIVEHKNFIRFLDAETRQLGLRRRCCQSSPLAVDPGDQDRQDLESMAGSYISDSYFPQDWETMSLQEVLRSARSAVLDSDEDRAEDYAKNVGKRRHSSTVDKKQDQVEVWGSQWKHKVTIPVPFRMTIRDEVAPIRASYSQNFLQQLLKEQEEKADVHKTKVERGFRANPVPTSTYLPLFEEMLKKNQERRLFVREYSKEMLQQKMKPFNVSNSRNGDHRRRCTSMEDLHSQTTSSDQRPFKAKPVPKDILNGKIAMEIRERELKRKEKKLERAEQLLRNSRGPSNMQATNHSEIPNALKSKRRHQHLCATNDWAFKPKISEKVPNFAALHNEFQRSLEEAKLRDSRITVPEPFDLRINARSRRPHHHETHKEGVKRHHVAARRSRSMGNLKSTSDGKNVEHKNTIVSKPNTAAVLREAAIKRQLNEMNDLNRKLLLHLRQRGDEGEKIRERMRAKLIDYDLSREAKERERAVQRRSASQSSQALFEQFKLAIFEKLSERQSLLDRQNMLSAKQSIDKRYRKALESAGLKGVSVTTAMSSIGRILAHDKDAAAAISAAVASRRSVGTGSEGQRSTRSLSPSASNRSVASSSAIAESVSEHSENTVTAISNKSNKSSKTSVSHPSDKESVSHDSPEASGPANGTEVQGTIKTPE